MSSPEQPEFGSPIPLSDIEDVLSWVDSFKLSRPTKKINRDFADAVLLAEILAVFYPKLVEMHNYPPRNSQAQKLNNWMTLNRKVLKKLKLNLCIKTMEQLSNSIPGAIERVLIMAHDKIKRDEETSRSESKDLEQNVSSGGSYYEACSEEDNVLVVPVKQRCGGSLEVMQRKVVGHEVYLGIREQLRDAREANETLKQKLDHFEDLIKIKIERIDELQKQLSRKVSRRKETEDLKITLSVPIPLTEPPPSPKIDPKYSVSQNTNNEKELNSTSSESNNIDLKEEQQNCNVENYIITEKSNDVIIGTHETEAIKLEEPDLKEPEIKDRKTESKTELRSKIPVFEKTDLKPQILKDVIDNPIRKGISETLNCQGDEDEMSFYN